jgi:hypothetical protein
MTTYFFIFYQCRKMEDNTQDLINPIQEVWTAHSRSLESAVVLLENLAWSDDPWETILTLGRLLINLPE